MAQPKRKMSHSKTRNRKMANHGQIFQAAICSEPGCGAPKMPHRVCTACGMYKGRQVLTIKAEK